MYWKAENDTWYTFLKRWNISKHRVSYHDNIQYVKRLVRHLLAGRKTRNHQGNLHSHRTTSCVLLYILERFLVLTTDTRKKLTELLIGRR